MSVFSSGQSSFFSLAGVCGFCAFLGVGCADGANDDVIAVLVNGSHSISNVLVDIIGDESHGLNGPRDLDFNPGAAGELWVVNQIDDGVVRYVAAGSEEQDQEHRIDSFAMHFMEEVSSLSFSEDTVFGAGSTFATCQESDNTYNHQQSGNNFMGPTLWTSDWEIFGFSNPDAVEAVGYDLGSHIDMMHESPFCMGIDWENANAYWTVDGLAQTISRYDFGADHDVGYDDHSDGNVERYIDAEYTRVEGIPSHIVYNPNDGMVYYNDTGAGRIMRLDPSSATQGADISEHSHDGGEFYNMDGGDLTVLVSADDGDLVHPSGLALHEDVLYVTDNATGRISAFDLDGDRIDYLDTEWGEGSLMGLTVDDKGHIWAVDFKGNRVLRIREKP